MLPLSSCLANAKYVWLHVLLLSLSPCKEPSGLTPLPCHVLLCSWDQGSSRRSYYPAGLPEPILTRRLTWKVAINLFIRFGIQLALSFEVSASLITEFCLFMFFLWLEKFLAGFSQALGEIFQKLLVRYTYVWLNLLFGAFFQEELISIFAFGKTLCGLRVWGFPINFFSPQNIFFFISNLLLTVLGLLLFAPICAWPEVHSWTSWFSPAKPTRTLSGSFSMGSSCTDKAMSEIMNLFTRETQGLPKD